VVPVVSALLLLLTVHQVLYVLELLPPPIFDLNELAYKQFFAQQHTLVVDDVVELGILCVVVLFVFVFILVVFILIVDVVLSVDTLGAFLVLPIFVGVIVELLEDVLDLLLELLVTLVH